ncbi:Flavin-dependent thymidylate synthase [Moorella thermoacetica]|uniref:FAD-dependent thymidylate synthase n=1 Tax=Neomoorella thermoacetica TaxID=1525 RepID=A0AAC9HIL2_NEOTH|nr:FAD-dependent thymidylate synthase [Moorella thermoacetica]AOQ24563.1 Thymidylate synthase ThyX [Moorella thermoacetica]TYL12664.1 Flavin-dependent thymidylate synthase [Moorella thermoacetica]
MQVTLINSTNNLLDTLWTACRTCKSAEAPQELWAKAPTVSSKERLVLNVLKAGHLSIAEHCAFTFAISGISRSCLAQLTRHRIGCSYSVQSQRYVDTSTAAMVMPPSIQAAIDSGNIQVLHDWNQAVTTIQVMMQHIKEEGIRQEDARFLLPNAAPTNLVMTVNLRSLHDLWQKRVVVKGAQWEIRNLVQQMVKEVLDREPWLEGLFHQCAI